VQGRKGREEGGRAHLSEAQRGAARASSATAALRAGRGSDGGDGEAENEVEARNWARCASGAVLEASWARKLRRTVWEDVQWAAPDAWGRLSSGGGGRWASTHGVRSRARNACHS
jgi:hypothetical protein